MAGFFAGGFRLGDVLDPINIGVVLVDNVEVMVVVDTDSVGTEPRPWPEIECSSGR